jgi:ACT domain-containing protein
MKYVIVVKGKDRIGIIAEIMSIVSKNNINIYSVEQSVIKNIFKMITYVEVENEKSIAHVREEFKVRENDLEVKINIFTELEFEK